MVKSKIRVAVLYNHIGDDIYEQIREVRPEDLDFTPEYDIHVATVKEEIDVIVEALRSEGYRATAVNVEENLARLHQVVRRSKPDVIFNLVEFFRSDQGLESSVAGLFDLHGIPYTGAPPFGLALCQRKGLTKHVLLQHGVSTPKFKLLRGKKIQRRHGLHYPLIVKPSREDGSSGVTKDSVVYDYGGLIEVLSHVFDTFGPPILVEEFIEGKELHVSILGNDPPEALPIIEFDFSDLPEDHPAIITYDVKWNPLDQAYHKVHSQCPAALPRRIEKKVREQALLAYGATHCRDYARIDMRLSRDDRPYVLEVNPNPDLTVGVSFMEAAEEAGLAFSETLAKIVAFALARSAREEP